VKTDLFFKMSPCRARKATIRATLFCALCICWTSAFSSFTFQSKVQSFSSSSVWRKGATNGYQEEGDTDECLIVNGRVSQETCGPSHSSFLDETTQREHQYNPYEILFPDSIAYMGDSAHLRQLPLHSVLRLFRQALDKIASHQYQIPRLDNNTSSAGNSQTMIRIEHILSHSVDPLCWLQAQTQYTRGSHHNLPVVYFATAEGTLETAVYGSSKTITTTAESDDYWKLVANLPEKSHLYGGQRFDTHSETRISDEWKDFGSALWVLPAVELRRTQQRPQVGTNLESSASTYTLAVHLYSNENEGFAKSAQHILSLLHGVTDAAIPAVPPTTLPPVLSRTSNYGQDLDGQELYERGVTEALEQMADPSQNLDKVVLARRLDLTFGRHVDNLQTFDILRKWKFASQPGGHLFYIRPSCSDSEFFGCTPERLFRVNEDLSVLSEALAGTRPRGPTQQADELLARELFASSKDQAEFRITGVVIREAFEEMQHKGWLVEKAERPTTKYNNKTDAPTTSQNHVENDARESFGEGFFVRRLRHLQHICQRFQGQLSSMDYTMEAMRYLFSSLHPTPALGGFPKDNALAFIREHESIGFDRGFYSGPVGFVGKNAAEIVVGIRSGLVSRTGPKTSVSVYAGAGIVPGSTVQGEWAETSYKLAVVSSIFPQSPITLQSQPSPNAAWATAFIEELIRNGVTQFYICPGSRSTPLVAAVAKAVRSHVGVVHAVSIHDERGACFRAIGYGRGAGRPAAIITSSGTAIANLYPAIIEAGMDGIPLLVLTADRPCENRDTGANQAIDQVKAFSSTYIRWFRDILPPHDDVPVAVALADAAHAVSMSRKLRGPVHMNIQFRENLAPDGGPIRNDNRDGSITSYDGLRFTDIPGFQRWSIGGGQWQKSYSAISSGDAFMANAVAEIAHLISQSSRGVIVVGILRTPTDASQMEDAVQTAQIISDFAQSIGFPIIAGVQSSGLRFDSPAVIPFAEHLLRSPLVKENLKPDLVLQFGAPLVSTEVPSVVKATMSEEPMYHVLVHPHHSHERADPDFTVTHKISAEIGPFLRALLSHQEMTGSQSSSNLAPLVLLGRRLQSQMAGIITGAARDVLSNLNSHSVLTEPEIVLCLSQSFSGSDLPDLSLFLSNSMTVRDAEAFLYPYSEPAKTKMVKSRLLDVGVNRGASGIDGVIASATGFADSTDRPTTLVIGDVAFLHDLNSLHALRAGKTSKEAQAQKIHPLTTIILNNDGGGIFSFLPISKHGDDVSFDEFFGTPTHTFSFEAGSKAFGIPFQRVSSSESFGQAYSGAMRSGEPSIIEAEVAPRDVNVVVHGEITKQVGDFIATLLDNPHKGKVEKLPINQYARDGLKINELSNVKESKTFVLLHGWMGDKSDWDVIGSELVQSLSTEWSIISIDLPGHGEAIVRHSSDLQSVKNALNIEGGHGSDTSLSVEQMALSVLDTLYEHHGVKKIDVLAGYSLGGRVALAMHRMSTANSNSATPRLLDKDTKIVLLGAYPGELPTKRSQDGKYKAREDSERMAKDDLLSSSMMALSNRASLSSPLAVESAIIWSNFLSRWYGAPLWGNLNERSRPYTNMIAKRIAALSTRGPDLAAVLRHCSPPRYRDDDWRAVLPEKTLYIAGGLDSKYSSIGKEWSSMAERLQYVELPDVGHALLVEAPTEVSDAMIKFILTESASRVPLNSLEESGVSIPKASIPAEMLPRLPIEPVLQADRGKNSEFIEKIGALDFEAFKIDLVDDRRKESGVFVGWGVTAKAKESNRVSQRSGFIVQMLSPDGSRVGVGEVSPLRGLHIESFEDTEDQLNMISDRLHELEPRNIPSFDASRILGMDGAVGKFLSALEKVLSIEKFLPSVRAGLEMALVSLASQVVRVSLHQALAEYSPESSRSTTSNAMVPLNGLITRGSLEIQSANGLSSGNGDRKYKSLKVKVGHQDLKEDVLIISQALQILESNNGVGRGLVRADANRAWDDARALEFAANLEGMDLRIAERIEYVEEPLEKQVTRGKTWALADQVEALERWYKHTAIPYALDESISDLAEGHQHDFEAMSIDLRTVYPAASGCAALILKPSLLGLELSLQLARLARNELGIGAVFTSTFDSGVGLAYASFLSSTSDASPAKEGVNSYSHGIGTFGMLAEDTLSPSFGSYVNERGLLNVVSLSRAFYGLSLDEIRDSSIAPPPPDALLPSSNTQATTARNETVSLSSEEYEASTVTSSSGREISVVVSLPLPFSADIACARFTDLPQQPRYVRMVTRLSFVIAFV
jgi:2-succinyl-5-enolpyruvyl-6-hydroxy-3-cyclohexene-1-carboxylate synthase